MTLIELTRFGSGQKVVVNFEHVVSLHGTAQLTSIQTTKEALDVKESRDVIERLILDCRSKEISKV